MNLVAGTLGLDKTRRTEGGRSGSQKVTARERREGRREGGGAHLVLFLLDEDLELTHGGDRDHLLGNAGHAHLLLLLFLLACLLLLEQILRDGQLEGEGTRFNIFFRCALRKT